MGTLWQFAPATFNNCQIYRSVRGHAAAFWMDLWAGSIGTVALNSCCLRNQFSRTYLDIPYLIPLSGVDKPVINMLRINGCDFENCQTLLQVDEGRCYSLQINGLSLHRGGRSVAEVHWRTVP